MQSEPNKEGLLKLLKRKKLTGLIEELTNDDEALADWKSTSKEDWEKYYGFAGVQIYNYLHPNPKGILMLNSRNYFKINSWN